MALLKYLQHYAEDQCQHLPHFEQGYDYALVIPARDEAPGVLDEFERLCQLNPRLLIILVVNSPEGDTTDDALGCAARKRYPLRAHADTLELRAISTSGHLLVVDRCSRGQQIPLKQGVGLARKLGCDIACQLISDGIVDSPWIFTSDADARLPEDYFGASHQLDAAALTYPFQHKVQHNPLAVLLYEFSINYYVAGLQHAGSPYAYPAVGSTLALHYRHYARVRGFPKRAGGEDFYILNKLRKSGAIVSPATAPIVLQDRLSHRVPFGTGPALIKINAMDDPVRDFTLYHPGCFDLLQEWLRAVPTLFACGDADTAWAHLRATLGQPNLSMLQALGIDKCLAHAYRHSSTSDGFTRHVHNWFDAFRTLKAIHHYRDNGLASLPFMELITAESFLQHTAGD